jgi:hypothetical protein
LTAFQHKPPNFLKNLWKLFWFSLQQRFAMVLWQMLAQK